MRINRQNLKWLGRMMMILSAVVGVAEILVVPLRASAFAVGRHNYAGVYSFTNDLFYHFSHG